MCYGGPAVSVCGPQSHTIFLPPCTTKNERSQRQGKVQVRAKAVLSYGRKGRAKKGPYWPSPDPDEPHFPYVLSGGGPDPCGPQDKAPLEE